MTAKPKYKLRSKDYARQYGCSEISIKRYRAKSYPLDDPAQMAVLFAAQKSRPAGVQNLVEGVSEEYEDVGEVVAGETGGGGALNAAAKLNVAKLEKVLLECKRLAFRNDVERGLYTLNSELQPKLQSLLSETKAALRKALESELPAKCEGLSAADIQLRMREALDDVLGDLTRGTSKLAATAPQISDDPTPNISDDDS